MTTLKGSGSGKLPANKGLVKVQKRVKPILVQLNRLEHEGIFRAYALSEDNIDKLRNTLLEAVNTSVDAIEAEIQKVQNGVSEEVVSEPGFEF